QIREADQYTILNEPISDEALMERAAGKCAEFIMKKWNQNFSFLICCGPGNNGGDGLVIARKLAGENYKVAVVCVDAPKYSDSFNLNYERLNKQGKVNISIISNVEDDFPKYDDNTIIIDALFGSGLSKKIKGVAAEIITKINNSNNYVISIDMPSGLIANCEESYVSDVIIKANLTLTFHCPKLAFFMPENYEYLGEWYVIDIGLHKDYIDSLPSNYYYIEKEDIKSLIKPRHRFSHKGNYGHALLISGSHGKIGAAVLAAKACLKSGAGMLTIRAPKCGYEIIQTSIPEAMIDEDENLKYITPFNFKTNYSAIGIGPGIGQSEETATAFKFLIQNYQKPIIIDADAINILSSNTTWLSFIPKHSILTPHPKEFTRIAGTYRDDKEKIDKQINFSYKYNVYIVLKGAYTSISCPDGKIFFNSTGNPGMATAGSGDVLTGILLGLLAQGYTSLETCLIGVWVHGKSGDIAAKKKGEISLIASDIIENLGEAFLSLD
ncbi:MAG TPA: NAD(P)H-hydrate dehydratase, partial [Bacteroidales bacterium]|nr:NAD(P)H-hydrate dehydratase [Bacteroidales bacterium]